MQPTYRERAPHPALARHVRCVWAAVARPAADPRAAVLPDGCADVVWTPGRAPWIAGPDTGPQRESLPEGALVVGVRFHPGAADVALGAALPALVNARPALAALWPARAARAVADALEGAPGADVAMDALETALAPHLVRAPQPDPLVAAAVAEIRRAVARGARPRHGEPNASAARRLRRRFAAAVGYGPKTFERVVRFQRFRALARREGGRSLGLADLAAACGYADQAHLARECRRLAGLPPAALRAFASETFKTARRDPTTLGA
jgi:hypothetical protein